MTGSRQIASEATAKQLEREQESNQIVFLGVGKADAKPLVIEVDDGIQVACRAVMEIGSPCRERAQDRALESSDVLPFAGDKRAARIGGLNCWPVCLC